MKKNEVEYISANSKLKKQVQHLEKTNEDFRAKLEILKGMTKNTNQYQ